jgi:hypothetical protein
LLSRHDQRRNSGPVRIDGSPRKFSLCGGAASGTASEVLTLTSVGVEASAAAEANAKPQLPITNPTCHLAVERMCQITSPLDGMATLTPEQAKALVDGKWYFNLHTSANPGGEVRCQILKSE